MIICDRCAAPFAQAGGERIKHGDTGWDLCEKCLDMFVRWATEHKRAVEDDRSA